MLPTCRIFRNGGRGTPFSRSSRSGGLWRWPKSPKLCSLFPGNLKIFMCFRFLRRKKLHKNSCGDREVVQQAASKTVCGKTVPVSCAQVIIYRLCQFFLCFVIGNCVLEWKISKLSMRHSNTDFFQRGFLLQRKTILLTRNNRFCRQTLPFNTRGPWFDWLCYWHIIVSEVSLKTRIF